MKGWTDQEIVEMMIFIDSDGFNRGLSIKYHSSKWWALESILRERHGENWNEVLGRTA